LLSESRVRHDLPSSIVNVPREHHAGATTVLIHPQFERLTTSIELQFIGHRPCAALVIPDAEGIAADSYLTTIIRSKHELNGLMFRYVDEACHVNHEEVVGAVLEWFAVIGTVDVVLNL
jgi:hypothetical protein